MPLKNCGCALQFIDVNILSSKEYYNICVEATKNDIFSLELADRGKLEDKSKKLILLAIKNYLLNNKSCKCSVAELLNNISKFPKQYINNFDSSELFNSENINCADYDKCIYIKINGILNTINKNIMQNVQDLKFHK